MITIKQILAFVIWVIFQYLNIFRRRTDKQLVVETRVWSERQRAYKDPNGEKVQQH